MISGCMIIHYKCANSNKLVDIIFASKRFLSYTLSKDSD